MTNCAMSQLIDSDSAVVFFGGYLSDYNGSDIPAFKLGFFDLNNEAVGTTGTYENKNYFLIP